MNLIVPEFDFENDLRIDIRKTIPISFGDGQQAEFVRLKVDEAHFVFALRVQFAPNRFKQASWASNTQDPNRNNNFDNAVFRLSTAWKRELIKRRRNA